MRPIGILGGMGPEASADVYMKIIKLSYGHAAANMDAYPHILINNVPAPNIFQRFNPETGIYLGQQARVLENAGAKAIGVACNSAHHYWADMRAALSQDIWLVDMIDEVAGKVERDGYRKVGLLSSSMSRPLYEGAIGRHSGHIASLGQSEQLVVDRIIARILSGERTIAIKSELLVLADSQMERGAQCVILGCTDLPILLGREDVSYPLYASNDVLAQVLFDFAVKDQ